MVSATLSFIKPLDLYKHEVPYFLNISGDSEAEQIIRTNLEYEPHENIVISDLRENGLEAHSIDMDGYAVLKHETKARVNSFDDNVQTYCEEIADLIFETCCASRVVCYDYRVSYIALPSSN
jgi:hypothetical protein